MMDSPLNLPLADLKISRRNNKIFIWCLVRKKNLVLTQEEWVRQHVIHYLLHHKSVPIGAIASEMTISVNNLTRRCDIVVFNKSGKPVIIIECKAKEIVISEKTFYQIAQYNAKLRVGFLMMTNGMDHFVCKINLSNGNLEYLQELPEWEILND